VVDHVYTDLRHHDLGPRFWDRDYLGGTVYPTRFFRTAPLWGVGSTAPYGHDGRSLSLDDVVRRHGGEAAASADAYRYAAPSDRRALLSFLASLVLYQPDLLPAELDGNRRIDAAYRREGIDLGPELFRPELLFRTAPRYRGWTSGPDGGRFFSYELLNVRDAYGQDLAALRDENDDGWPDVVPPPRGAARPH
jgi:hypothetical protein